jgi:hypothetical protein
MQKSGLNRKFEGMRASKNLLSLLWISNEAGTERGFSAYTLSEFCGLGHRSTRELLDRLRKRGIIQHNTESDLYTIRKDRTVLSGRDGLPYETGIAQKVREARADRKDVSVEG